jgi:hypothetical protein
MQNIGSILRRYVVGWFQLQFVVGLVVYSVLTRGLSTENFVIVLNEVPFLVAFFHAITRVPFRLIAGEGLRQAPPSVGSAAAWWSICVEVVLDLVLVVYVLDRNFLLYLPVVVLLRALSARSAIEAEYIAIHRSPRTAAQARDQEHVIALVRQVLLLFAMVLPDHAIWGLWTCTLAYGVETLLLNRLYAYLYRIEHSTPRKAQTWTDSLAEFKQTGPYILESLKTVTFQRGERFVVMVYSTLGIARWLERDYAIVSNIRFSLQTAITRPVAQWFGDELRRGRKNKQPLDFKKYYLAWFGFVVLLGMLAPTLAWPILYLAGDGLLLNDSTLVAATGITLVLFAFELADELIAVYCRVYRKKPISLWLDGIGSFCYLFLSVTLLQMFSIRGAVYAILCPIFWRLLLRGPWL